MGQATPLELFLLLCFEIIQLTGGFYKAFHTPKFQLIHPALPWLFPSARMMHIPSPSRFPLLMA